MSKRLPVKKYPDGGRDEVLLRGRDKFRTESFYVILDKLAQELKKRSEAYNDISQLFGFLTKIPNISDEEITLGSSRLINTYKNDVSDNLTNELVQFCEYVRDNRDIEKDVINTHYFLKLMEDNDLLQVFPNIYIILRIYLSIPITNCEGERSFSTLAFIKNKYRSTMGESRLSALSLLSIESDLMRSLDFSDLIHEFSVSKTRKQSL